MTRDLAMSLHFYDCVARDGISEKVLAFGETKAGVETDRIDMSSAASFDPREVSRTAGLTLTTWYCQNTVDGEALTKVSFPLGSFNL